MAHLKTPADIRAAGAAAVTGWDLPDETVERLVALLMPVREKTINPASTKRGAA